jgi:hypothetical protein
VGAGIQRLNGFRAGDALWLTLPGGETYTFTFLPVKAANQIGKFIPYFASVDAKSRLLIPQKTGDGKEHKRGHY